MAKKKSDTNAEAVETTAKSEEILEQTETVETSVSEVDELQAKIEELTKQLNDEKDSRLRLQADFENNRKRNTKLRIDSIADGKVEVFVGILKALDNFERALKVECTDKGYADGMQMIYKMLMDSLSSLGLEEIKAEGIFDPNFHEVVAQEEAENAESGFILAVMQTGFMFNGKVIRPTMVKVAK